MSEPINLNKFRKGRTRLMKRAQADANAVKFGRTKEDRKRLRAESERSRRALDRHKREPRE